MYNLMITSEKNKWKDILNRHRFTNTYLQYEYVHSMAEHLKARPIILDCSNKLGGFVYSLLVMDIANDRKFSTILSHGQFFDAETPYGYGGPFFYGEFSSDSESVNSCRYTLYNGLQQQGIISQFIRFYPFEFINGKSNVIVDKYGTYKSTVYIDLSSEDSIINNLDSQYRRKIRKAREASVKISHDKGDNISEFKRLYNNTMSFHNADDMYYFKNDYYEYLISNFSDNFVVFYAIIDGKTIGSSIFLYDKDTMHFHLGGRDILAPNIPFENLLMVEAALWGYKNGIKKLHIGGGLSDNDSLFQYKKKFNRSGILPFYIGRSIIDNDKYNILMNLRAETDVNFDPNNNYFIQYRF